MDKLDRERNRVHIPDGTLIAIAGRKDLGPDRDTVFQILDAVHGKHPKMCLAHGNVPGAVTLASEWARSRNVPQIVFNLDRGRYGKAAIVERDRAIIRAKPAGVIDFSPADKTTLLASLAERFRVPVLHLERAVDMAQARKARNREMEQSPRQDRSERREPHHVMSQAPSRGRSMR